MGIVEQLNAAREILKKFGEPASTRNLSLLEDLVRARIAFGLWLTAEQDHVQQAAKWGLIELWRLIDSTITDNSMIQNLRAFIEAGHDPVTLRKEE